MTTAAPPSVRSRPPLWSNRRFQVVAAGLLVLLVAAGTLVAVQLWTAPGRRIQFLIDTSAAGPSDAAGNDLADIVQTLSGAVDNLGDQDAVSLRRFGGNCDQPGNTEMLVSPGTRQGNRIDAATTSITATGRATLRDGVLAAVDDLSGRRLLPDGGPASLVVITRHGIDACTENPDQVRKDIEQRVRAAGLRLTIRVVGYRVPDDERATLIAAVGPGNAATPTTLHFTRTKSELVKTLRTVVIPAQPDAAPVIVPTRPSPTVPPADQLKGDWVDIRQPNYALRFTKAGTRLTGEYVSRLQEVPGTDCPEFLTDFRLTPTTERPAGLPADQPSGAVYFSGRATSFCLGNPDQKVPVQISLAPGKTLICYADKCRPLTRIITPQNEKLEISALIGSWSGHGRNIEIDKRGRVVYSSRTYDWCPEGAPANAYCDSIKGSDFRFGGRAVLDIISSRGHYTVQVTKSNIPGVAPGMLGRISTSADGVLTLKVGSYISGGLCGPDTKNPANWCGA